VGKVFVKDTFGAETVVKIAMFSDSVFGGWSFVDRFNTAFYDLIKYYKERGMAIELKDFSVDGGGFYSSRSAAYEGEDWMVAFDLGSPDDLSETRFTDRAMEAAVTWGATHAFLLYHTREATQGFVAANPAGGNYFGEETIVLIQSYVDFFDANSITSVISTCNAANGAPLTQADFDALSVVIREKGALANWNLIDTNRIMTDPATGQGRPGDYLDVVHWVQDNGTGIGHGRESRALQFIVSEMFGLLGDCPTLEVGQSMYFDGTNPVFTDFETKAPVNITSGFIKTTLQTPYDPTQDDLFELLTTIPTQPAEGDKFFALYDSGDTSKFITGEYLLSTLIFSVEASNGVTTVTSDSPSFDFSTAKNLGFDLEGVGNNKRVRAVVDAVLTTDDEFIDMTGVTFDTLVIGADITEVDTPHMHISGLQSLLIGNTIFISNEKDGNFAVSDIHDVYTITPNGGGDSFAPNYSPIVSERYPQPFTAAVRLNNDSITTVLATRRTGLESGFRFGKIFRANLSTATGQFIFEYTDSIDGSKIEGSVDGAGKVLVTVYDSAGTPQFQSTSPTVTALQILHLEVQFDGALTIRINGISGSVIGAGTLAAGLNIDTMIEGARGAGNNIILDLFQTFGPTFPKLVIIRRLWEQLDSEVNTLPDDEGNTWIFTEGTPGDGIAPNIGQAPEANLVSDTAIPVESGSPELQFTGNIAQFNNVTARFAFAIKP